MKPKEIVSLKALLIKGRKALAAFEEAVATDTGDKKSRDSLLLSFVFTFETAMNCLHAALAQRGMQVPDYAVAILKAGFQAELINDPTGWDTLRESRNDISHAYDEALAVTIAASVRQRAAPLIGELLTRLEQDG
jgi:nucleotidyltransferase substrate binding protein (TIGR01987 family)